VYPAGLLNGVLKSFGSVCSQVFLQGVIVLASVFWYSL
jgi:hypothetical protein